jgi:hypothetical protein
MRRIRRGVVSRKRIAEAAMFRLVETVVALLMAGVFHTLSDLKHQRGRTKVEAPWDRHRARYVTDLSPARRYFILRSGLDLPATRREVFDE